MHKVTALILLAAALLLLVASCGGSDPTPTPAATPTAPAQAATPTASEVVDQDVTVAATGALTFEPDEITVEPGQTVRFTVRNDSSFFHTFTIAVSTAKETILTDVALGGGETKTATVTFPDEPADLYLFCRPHEAAGMHGTIHSGTDEAGQAPQDSSSTEAGAITLADDEYDY